MGRTRSRSGVGQEQGRSRADQSRVEQGRKRAGAGQELGRNWGGARNMPDRSLIEAGQELGKGRAEAGAGEE